MLRIVFIVIRLIYRMPGWLLKVRKYCREAVSSLKERYDYVRNKIIATVLKVARVQLDVYGLDNLPQEQGYLLTPNHQGMFDPVAIIYTHKQPLRLVVKAELEHWIVIGKIAIQMLGCVPMDRDNLRQSVKVIREVSKQLKEGTNFVIFAEGTRSKKQNELLDFKAGSFKAAMNAQKPIVPVAMIDCYKVFDYNSLKRVHTQIHYLEPIYYEDYKDMTSQQVADLVKGKIEDCIREYA